MPSTSIFTSVVNSYLPEPHASLLNGILLGLPIAKTLKIYQNLQTLGLLHIVVLSGINISILAAFVGFSTSYFGKLASCLITILAIIFFIAFVRPQAPIVRAGIMGILTFVAIIMGRKSIALYSLFLSSLIVAIVWPSWIKSISFQLSYAATLGIILFAGSQTMKSDMEKTNGFGGDPGRRDPVSADVRSTGGREPRGRTHKTLSKFIGFIIQDLRITLSAQIFTVPLIFLYFKQISIIAPLSNLLVSFTIIPLMVFGFATLVLGKIHFLLGIAPAYICYGILTYVIFIVEQLSKLPFIFLQF